MERRRYARTVLSSASGVSAKLILSGGSLLETSTTHSIEIGADPLDISRGGIGLTLKLDVPWETLTPKKKVSLLLAVNSQVWLLPATVIRHEEDHRTIALEFTNPLESLSPFITPKELQ